MQDSKWQKDREIDRQNGAKSKLKAHVYAKIKYWAFLATSY